MALASKSVIDLSFIVLSVVGVGLLGAVLLKDNGELHEEKIVTGAASFDAKSYRPPLSRHYVWTTREQLNLDLEQMLIALKGAYTFEDPEQQNLLCDGMRRELGVSDSGDFLPAEQFEGRDAARRRKVRLLDRLVEYRLKDSTLSITQKDAVRKITHLRHLGIERLSDETTPNRKAEEIFREQLDELIASGADDPYLDYLQLLLNEEKKFSYLKRLTALSNTCMTDDVCPLLQLEVDFLYLSAFHKCFSQIVDHLKPSDYLDVLNRVRDSLSRVVQNHTDIDWTAEECWSVLIGHLQGGQSQEQAYMLFPLATGESNNRYLRHMLIGYCLQQIATEFQSQSQTDSELFQDNYQSVFDTAQLSSMHFQAAWLLQPEDSGAPIRLFANLEFGAPGFFSPQILLAIINFTDYDNSWIYWEYSKTLGYQGVLDFAEKCVATGAVGSDLPLRGICAIESYNQQCWPAQIYTDPRVAKIAALCARNLIAWMDTDEGKAAPEFMNRHTRHFAGSILVQHKRFKEAAELAMAVPDASSLNWFQPRYANSTFGTYLFTCLGSEMGLELAEVERVIHEDPSKLNESHLAVVEQLLTSADAGSQEYLENRLRHIELHMSLRDGQSYTIPATNSYVWPSVECEINVLDDSSFRLQNPKLSDAVVLSGLRMPVRYRLTMDLNFSSPKPDAKVYFKPRVYYPEDLRTNRSISGFTFFSLPHDQQQIRLDIDVNGTNLHCSANGVELASGQSGKHVPPDNPNLGMPFFLNTDVEVTVSNVTVHPAN